jgi:hypothetical protein
MKKKLWILGEYVGHLMLGFAMAAALLLFGGGLNMLVHWASPIIGDESFTGLMMMVDKLIMYADVAFIVWWAIYSTYKAIKEMLDE